MQDRVRKSQRQKGCAIVYDCGSQRYAFDSTDGVKQWLTGLQMALINIEETRLRGSRRSVRQTALCFGGIPVKLNRNVVGSSFGFTLKSRLISSINLVKSSSSLSIERFGFL
jgi:hypothetical protein